MFYFDERLNQNRGLLQSEVIQLSSVQTGSWSHGGVRRRRKERRGSIYSLLIIYNDGILYTKDPHKMECI